MAKIRADRRLVEAGLCKTSHDASRAILAGTVFFANAAHARVETPGQQVAIDELLEINDARRYVSRGGEKLAGALRAFGFSPQGLRTIDLGASTGGFTDCLLQAGAKSVCAVDVGYGQLAWKLQNDPRVTVFDRTNIRTADPVTLGAPFDLVVADLSFIALEKILPVCGSLISQGTHEVGDAQGTLLLLVKPQFEAAKSEIGAKGVVRDPATHRAILLRLAHAARKAGFCVRAITFSPITGPEGNIEFWFELTPDFHDALMVSEEEIKMTVKNAHERLGQGEHNGYNRGEGEEEKA